jgi:hypothetical protein
MRCLKLPDVAYAAPLAMYSIRLYREGRRLGGKLNVSDVSSGYCQKRKNVTVERLDRYDATEDKWQELLIEDRRCGPFDIVRTKLDFTAWLWSLPTKLRRIAKFLALGESTTAAARKFDLTEGRISQIRKELLLSWQAFVGEESVAA